MASPPSASAPQPGGLGYRYGLYPFVAENDDEISFQPGERIEILEQDDQYGDGWWQVRSFCPLACLWRELAEQLGGSSAVGVRCEPAQGAAGPTGRDLDSKGSEPPTTSLFARKDTFAPVA
jgi:hypothetical protein